MKKLSKLSLTHFSKKELEDRQMNTIRGGRACNCQGCGCLSTCQLDQNADTEFNSNHESENDSSTCYMCDCDDCIY